MHSALPELGPLLDGHGLGDARQDVLNTLITGGPQALQDVTDERLADLLSITGTPDEARAKFERYAESIQHQSAKRNVAPSWSN
jgi:hypothetical protein